MATDFGFIPTIEGLVATFLVIGKVPSTIPVEWDFGDSETAYNVRRVEHTYEKPGFYPVTVSYDDPVSKEKVSYSKTIIVTNLTHTQLTGSIYELINYYLPKELAIDMDLDEKQVYITKWQLYLGPLVNHFIPPEQFTNELYYEGLENQLVMELAVWDHLTTKLWELLAKAGAYLNRVTEVKRDGDADPADSSRGDRIKQITTGPTEVQFYDTFSESIANLYSTYYKALQPGGLIDELNKNLCILAERCRIWLPFCQRVKKVMTPKVVNHRQPGILGGPNPSFPVNGPGETIFG